MLRFILIISILTSIYHTSFAQESEKEKIEKRFYKFKDSARLNPNLSKKWLLNELSYFINNSEKHESLDSIRLRGLSWKAKILSQIKQKDSFLFYKNKFVDFFEEDPRRLKKYPKSYASLIPSFSSTLVQMGHYNEAYEMLTNTINQLNQIEYKGGLGKLYRALAYVEGTGLNDTDQAIRTLKKILKMHKSGVRKEYVLSSIGNNYISKNLDSAEYYKQKACNIFKKYGYKGVYHGSRSVLAHILIKKGKLDEGKKILQESITFLENSKTLEQTYLAYSYYYLSNIYSYQGNLIDQEKNLLAALKLLNKEDELILSEDIHNSLGNVYYKKGDFKKAFTNELKAKSVRDSLFSQQKINAVQEMRTKYEVKQKEQELATQRKIVSLQQTEKNRLIVGLSFLIFLLGISTFFYFQKIKAQKQLLQKQQKLNEHEMNSLLEKQKLSSIQSYVKGQNKERERIARDLHDSISGNLAAIKLKLSTVQDQIQDMDTIVQSVDKTYREVRAISHDLMPKEMEVNSFVAMVEQLVNSQKSEKLTVNTDFFPIKQLDTLPIKIKLEIYRVIQEILTNIHKHAQATQVYVSLTLDDNDLNLIIEDDGKGFDPKILQKGIGLKNIENRVKELSGVLDIDSVVNQGTTINMSISLIKN